MTDTQTSEWKPWNGYSEDNLSPPVEEGQLVDIKTRHGNEYSRQRINAGEWDHCDDDWDIVEFRVVKP